MAVEIERKFLVAGSGWRGGDRQEIVQGYLASGPVTVRVRRAGNAWLLTIKGPPSGLRRAEFEYPVPEADARELLALCGDRLIHKTRHRLRHGDHLWEVDEFHDANAGLILAEVELQAADERPEPPPWLGREVSSDPRFTNAALAARPYRNWPSEERDNL